MTHSLPNVQCVEERPLEHLLATLVSRDRSADEYYLAVSLDFWEIDKQVEFDSIFEAYSRFFDSMVERISRIAGPPDYRGARSDTAFPEWMQGLEIAVWHAADSRFWLRIEHEDRECPIIVALAPLSD